MKKEYCVGRSGYECEFEQTTIKYGSLEMKENSYISTKKVKSYKSNPFVERLGSLNTSRKPVGFTSSRLSLVDRLTGEFAYETSVVARKKVDKQEFVKIFVEGLEAALILRRPIDLLLYIIKILAETNTNKFSSDTVYLNYHAICYDHKYPKSQGVFISARNELCVREFIAPVYGRRDIFYINPERYFKGDRLKLKNKCVT